VPIHYRSLAQDVEISTYKLPADLNNITQMKSNWADFVPVSVRETESSYTVYEPVTVGPYTIQIWRVSSNGSQHHQKPTGYKIGESISIRVQSYLPDHTVPGLVLPKFNFQQKSKSPTPRGSSPVYLRGRTISTPTPFFLHSMTSQHPDKSSTSFNPLSQSEGTIHDDGSVWQGNIYKNGDYVEPWMDSALKNFEWAKKQEVWANKTLTKPELCMLICDIFSLFEDKKSQQEVYKWISLRPEQDSGNEWALI